MYNLIIKAENDKIVDKNYYFKQFQTQMALKGQFLFFFILNKHYAQLTSILLQDLPHIFGIYTFNSGDGCFEL